MRKFFIGLMSVMFTFMGGAQAQPITKRFTPQREAEMKHHNSRLLQFFDWDAPLRGDDDLRPYSDYEDVGYLIISAQNYFGSLPAKRAMVQNLPAGSRLILYDSEITPERKTEILDSFADILPADRIVIAEVFGNGGDGFWSRDGLPVPVLKTETELNLVDALYYHEFEPDAEIADLFRVPKKSHGYYFEGGNFQANSRGDCVIVNNSRHALIPDPIFRELYGCKRLIRLPYRAGIGHVDERARFINSTTLVTDLPEYKERLEAEGFTVALLPSPTNYYETYVNSLILGDRVIVPIFSQETDQAALEVYSSLGLTAIGTDASELANSGGGSIHCISMTYPRVPLDEVLGALGAVAVR
jgi:hypothetical protein